MLKTNSGVMFSLASSCLFAGLYFYVTLLAPLDGKEVYAWRMVLTLPCITIFMIVAKESVHITALFSRVKAKPSLFFALCVSSALVGLQQWLFLWAPLNGHGLDLSLGYFLLPLVMLAVGRVLYGERLTPLQKAAAGAAALGVLHQLHVVGGFSWVTLAVAIGFPAYFILRRKLRTDNLGGFWFDMLLTLPFAIALLARNNAIVSQFSEAPRLFLLIPLLAVLSALGYITYILANRKLSFGLFGLLGYVEPALMVGVALLLGEHVGSEEAGTYVASWMAVGLLIVDGAMHIKREYSRSNNEL